jgi:hypothetical protein
MIFTNKTFRKMFKVHEGSKKQKQTCIIARCSNPAKFAFDPKYPPLSVPGILEK